MKNTIGNKRKLFAQYCGQKIVIWNEKIPMRPKLNILINELDEKDILQLKPLSSITDEDAIEVAVICDFVSFPDEYIVINAGKYVSVNHQYNDYQDEFSCFRIYSDSQIFGIDEEGNTYESDFERIISAADFLRSKGYALPFNGLSIDQQIEYGWVRIQS